MIITVKPWSIKLPVDKIHGRLMVGEGESGGGIRTGRYSLGFLTKREISLYIVKPWPGYTGLLTNEGKKPYPSRETTTNFK